MHDNTALSRSLLDGISHLARTADDRRRRFMEQLAERQREPNHGETSVEDAEEFFRERQEAVNFLKQLSDAGCGQFFTGRRGRPTRIEWASCGAIPIARAFIQMPTDVSPGVDQPSKEGFEKQPEFSPMASAAPSTAKSHTHSFLLRPNLTVAVELPLDLTKEEANRLADFIRAIPF